MYRRILKRALDVTLSAAMLFVIAPALLVIGLLVTIVIGGPPLFRQERAGLREKSFTIYKFRTMKDLRDENGNLRPDAERLGRLGSFLRQTSLDELPELLNIVRGDMSFVGPRPLVMQYLPYYTPEERRRHSVRPGLTGLAQVGGRNRTTWEQRFAYDLRYVETCGFFTDIGILFRTFSAVLRRADIGTRGIDSPPDFDAVRSRATGHENTAGRKNL